MRYTIALVPFAFLAASLRTAHAESQVLSDLLVQVELNLAV